VVGDAGALTLRLRAGDWAVSLSPGPEAVGQRLRRARLAAPMTLEELADRSGVSVRAISDLERGRTRKPYPRTLRLLTAALGLPVCADGDLVPPAWRADCNGTSRQLPPALGSARMTSAQSSAPVPEFSGREGELGAVSLQNHTPTADPALAAAGVASTASAKPDLPTAEPVQHSPRVIPRQLPPQSTFVGRASELAALTRLLDEVGAPGMVVISAIGGTAGVGKTALAVHWAHRVAERFPDGQLYVNLRGFAPPGLAMTSARALRLILDSLGVPAAQIPESLDGQAGLYRSLLAGLRMLIVVDNARDPADVRPLLPGGAGCLVLVTSRNQLTALAASHGARLLTLDVLTEQEACEMLSDRLGPGRVTAEPAAAGELAWLCGRLPLALSIAAARAAAQPSVTLGALVAELRDGRTRLDALRTGDAATDMRTVFSWSCQYLTGPAAGMFGLLGVHPGPDITVPAAASLAGVSLPHVRQALAELARGHLVTEHAPGRYACHDLLRSYASEQASQLHGDQARRDTLRRCLDHYLHSAVAADRLLDPDAGQILMPPPHPQVRPEQHAGRRQALEWLQAEREVLVNATSRASAEGFTAHAWRLAWAVSTFLRWHGYWHDLAATQRIALAALRGLGEQARQVPASRLLALAWLRLGEPDQANIELSQALEQARQLGSYRAQAKIHADLAEIARLRGDLQAAISHAEQSLLRYRAAGSSGGEARALNNLGWHHAHLGSYLQALSYCQQAVARYDELNDPRGHAGALDSLGYVHHHLGHYADAIGCYQQALGIHGGASDPHARTVVLAHLGDSQHAAGQAAAAAESWQQALDILDTIRDPAAGQLRSRLASQLAASQPVPARSPRPHTRGPRQPAPPA
jgi:tetratricopeptide (TPR) repeat protein/DNA-binding XRE family transcriptional regulator